MIIVLVVALACVSAVSAQLSGHVKTAELQAIRQGALQTLSKPPALAEAFFATQVLVSSKTSGFACDCASLGSLFKAAATHLDVYYGVAAGKACQCGLEASADTKAAAQEALKSDVLLDVAGAALLVKVAGLKPKGGDVISKLKSFMTSDGKFRTQLTSKATSLVGAKAALRALAAYADENADAALGDVFAAALSLLPSGEDDHAVDAAVLAPLSKLSSSKPKLVGARLVAVAESLLQLRHSARMEVLADVLVALDVVQAYKATPVHVSLVNPVLGAEALSKTLVVTVVDIRGTAVAPSSIEAKAVKRVGRDNVMFQGALDGSTLDLSSLDGFVPGLYTADLALTLPGQPKPVATRLSFVIQGKVDVVQVKVGVTSSKVRFDPYRLPMPARRSLSHAHLRSAGILCLGAH